MLQTVIALAEVLARHFPAYEQNFGARLLPSHRRAVEAILSCRTPARGGHLYGCRRCGHLHYQYHSCQHRACPKCGNADASRWLEKQKQRLLPVPYFLVTFTIPEELRALFRSHQRLCYERFFKESAASLQDLGANKKYLGGELGMMGVLHTWTRQLLYHPHIHYVVAGGALRGDGRRWLRLKNPEFLFPAKVLALRFRHRFQQALQAHPEQYQKIPASVWTKTWNVDLKAVGGGEPTLKYLAAYIFRTALSSARVLRDENNQVTFRYKDGEDGQWKTTHLHALEFIRRFLQHILPKGWQRVRYFGWFSAPAKRKWQQVLQLLDWATKTPLCLPPVVVPVCPKCQQPLSLIGRLPRCRSPSTPHNSERAP